MTVLLKSVISFAVAATLLTGTSRAEIIGGVDFPQGAVSFADAVFDFTPVIKSGQPTAPNLNSSNSLGAPDRRYVSLGDGGFLTLQFVDNRLTGSGSSDLDLWVFEVGGDVEDTFVEVSKDNVTYFAVGKVSGATSGIDLDSFGFGTSDLFAYVRLQDDPLEGGQTGSTVGADIDALGAITSAQPIPEPSTCLLLLAGLTGIVARSRWKR